ncbi:hypothetical protein V2J09_024357 [Rumex salicifolius]
MDSETKQKVEAKVREILQTADMDTATELKVRELAAESLGIDLSDNGAKKLVRDVVDEYLLSAYVNEHQIRGHGDGKENTNSNLAGVGEARVNGGGLKSEKNANLTMVGDRKENGEQPLKASERDTGGQIPANRNRDDGIKFLCKLSNKRSVAIKDSAGEKAVLVGEFIWKDGKRVPGSRGIGLPAEEWLTFRKNFPAIEEAIRKVKSQMRCEPEEKQMESADKSDPQHNIVEVGHGPEFKKQKSNIFPAEKAAQKQIKQKPAVTSTPNALNPNVMVRFDGKNYHDWACRMAPFLEQLKLAHVLVDPCPTALGANTNEVSIAAKKWMDDDYICRSNILSSLSDHLFDVYSKKAGSAKELWDELKLIYLTEEHGSKVSLVNEYMEFQMVEGKPVVAQAQELHELADTLAYHGMHVQECFHVNSIISKLPASWKDVGVKLMMENTVSVQMLMNSLKQEEELRRRGKRGVFPTITTDDLESARGRRGLPPLDRERKVRLYSICQKKGHSEEKCWYKNNRYERGT